MAGTSGNGKLLELRSISAGPGNTNVISGVSFELVRGEISAVVSLDMSGGKSTLLKTAAGLLEPSAGQVLFDGEDVYEMGFHADQRYRSRCAVVLEGGALLVNRSIWDNISLPLRYHGNLSRRELKLAIERLLAQCGFNEDLHAFPFQISARGRRLASFARAIARDPELVMVDRFFEGLEMPDWRRLFELVMELNQHSGVSWLLVSELDPGIFQVAERVAVLEAGRLLAYDFRRKLYDNPRIHAAFNAADVMVKARRDSERILLVESSGELDALGLSGSEATIDLDVATPAPAKGTKDLGETINIDGVLPRLSPLVKTTYLQVQDPDLLEITTPPTLDEGPDQTIDLPPRQELPGEDTIDIDRPEDPLAETSWGDSDPDPLAGETTLDEPVSVVSGSGARGLASPPTPPSQSPPPTDENELDSAAPESSAEDALEDEEDG